MTEAERKAEEFAFTGRIYMDRAGNNRLAINGTKKRAYLAGWAAATERAVGIADKEREYADHRLDFPGRRIAMIIAMAIRAEPEKESK